MGYGTLSSSYNWYVLLFKYVLDNSGWVKFSSFSSLGFDDTPVHTTLLHWHFPLLPIFTPFLHQYKFHIGGFYGVCEVAQ